MAETNTTAAINHLSERDGMITMSIARKEAARQAAHEIEELCMALRESFKPSAISGSPDVLVRGMSKRIQSMACVVMSALDDGGDDVAGMFDEIGCELPN